MAKGKARAIVLIEKLGDGTFGDVWKGKDRLDRLVAVKIIREANADVSDAIAHAKALARTNHPNVVTVYSVDKLFDQESKKLGGAMSVVHPKQATRPNRSMGGSV